MENFNWKILDVGYKLLLFLNKKCILRIFKVKIEELWGSLLCFMGQIEAFEVK